MDSNIASQLHNIAEAIAKSAPSPKLSCASLIISFCSIIITACLTWYLIHITKEHNEKNQKLQRKLHEENEKLQYKLQEENERIQIKIHNTETRLELYKVVLSIYGAYLDAQDTITYCNKDFKSKIIFPNIFHHWLILLNDSNSKLTRAYNHAKIIFSRYDEKLFKRLEIIYKKYKEIYFLIQEYYESGKLLNLHDHAWNTICSITGISRYDISLIFNKDISEIMKNLLLTKETIEIQKNIDELLEMFEYGNFDKYFEPYLSFNEFAVRSATQQTNS